MANAEFECRRCGKTASAEQYKINRFCTKCGTYLVIKPQPQHWLFQFNPSIYNWFGRIKETKKPEQWLVTQHAKLIHKDDLVAIWSSGKQAGIYALGQIITIPIKNPLNPDQKQYFFDKDYPDKFREKRSVYVKYSKLCLEKPLLQENCVQDSTLMEMQVFMNPQGTNFRLTTAQWNKIVELLDKTEKC